LPLWSVLQMSVPVQPALSIGLQMEFDAFPASSRPASCSPASPAITGTQLPIEGDGMGTLQMAGFGPPVDVLDELEVVVEELDAVDELDAPLVVVCPDDDVLCVPVVAPPPVPLPLEQPRKPTSPVPNQPAMKRATLRM
jgi:hypothetical protein